MKRKLLALCFSLACVFGIVGFVACNEEKKKEGITPAEIVEYTLNEDGNSYTASSAKGYYNTKVEELVIADTYNGKPVTAIGDNAFYYWQGGNSVVIPDSVTSIGENAFFKCAGLKKISIGQGVTSIGDGAFMNCFILQAKIPAMAIPYMPSNYLQKLEVTNGVVEDTYGYNALTSVIIGDGVTEIKSGTFSCKWIERVQLGKGIKSLAGFGGCTGLIDITIPDGVTVLGDGAFSGCTGLTDIVVPDSVTAIGKSAFSGCTGLTDIIIPDSVTTIGEGAFANCTKMKNVTIGNGVKTIQKKAFYGCEALSSVVMGSEVERVEEDAFWDCGRLEAVYYVGTQTEWGGIYIELRGTPYLRLATIYYYSETKKQGCWRYVDGNPMIWE